MKFANLTSASLLVSLQQIASAATETECASALVSAASLMQGGVLAGQSTESFRDVLDACPAELGMHLGAVMDRAVNFHPLEEGGTLGLWLLPVAVSTDAVLPATIALETRTMNALKMSGCLLEQLELSAAKAGTRTGWTYVLPTLFSEEQIRNTDLGELVRLPHEARDVVRGTRKALSFTTGEGAAICESGVNLYYLPFVTFAPEGMTQTLPMASAKTTTRITQWATDTLQAILADGFTVHAGPAPQPFSLALRVGVRLRMDAHLRESMQRVCAASGVEPNGLAALVAPYATRQTDGTFMVGVSLVSRLTKNVVATLTLPVESDDGQDEVALTRHVLKDLGMECIQDVEAPIDTIACQHCGEFQFALPSADMSASSAAAPVKNLH
jgi:hypothetical protein